MQTFYFNTGVKPIDASWRPHHSGTREIPLSKGQVWRNGTKQIIFQCENVPEGATFKFACDIPDLPEAKNMIVREIVSEGMLSKYAYFSKPHK